MCIIEQSIVSINDILKKVCFNTDKEKIKRKRIISFRDCILHMCNYIYRNKSHQLVLDSLISNDKIGQVSVTAIKKKIMNYGYDNFSKLNEELLKLSYSKYKKTRIIAIDGSKLSLPRKFVDEGFFFIRQW